MKKHEKEYHFDEEFENDEEYEWFSIMSEEDIMWEDEEIEDLEEFIKSNKNLLSNEENNENYDDEEELENSLEEDEEEELKDEFDDVDRSEVIDEESEDEFDEFSRKKFSQWELKEMAAVTDLITSNQFIWKVDTKALLSAEQEKALFERMHSSYNKKEVETIKRFIVEKNIGLVVHFAKKMKQTTWWRKMKFEDLVQEWVVWLYSWINRFDYTKWFKLSTYATWYVRQKMQEFTSDHMFPVRITGHRMRELHQINKIREEFNKENHRDPTIDEIQSITWWPTSRMRDLATLMNWHISLDDQVWWDSWDWKSTYWDMVESTESIENEFSMQEILQTIQKSLNRLTPREKQLFQLHFWFENWKIQNEWMKFWEIEKMTWIDRVEIRKSIKKWRSKVIEELLKRWIDFSWRWWLLSQDDDYDDE